MAERVFAMPDLGEGLEEGKVVHWLVAEGDTVELNQPLVEVETAKAVVEVPSPFAGRIAKLHASEGDDVPVEDPLVTISVTGGAVAYPEMGRELEGPVAVRTTPPVRRLAKELGVDLEAVVGSGREGRITEADVRDAAASGNAPRASRAFETIEVTSTRREIARNLGEVAAIPQVTTFRTLDCSALEAFRAELGVSPLPIVIAALARVSSKHPLVNASWNEREIRTYPRMNVGLAVDTRRGLVVPVIHGVDRLGLDVLAAEIKRVATSARDGHLSMHDVGGEPATVGVSNTGSYGSEAGTPLLTPGCAVTLALGVIADRALVVDGAVVARPAATLSLTFDHRVLDGAVAGRALTDLVDLLQSEQALRDLPR